MDREERLLAALRHRPVLADPLRGLETRHVEVERLRDAARACVERGLDRRAADVAHLAARLTTLGPAATLARGYAVVQRVPRGSRPGDAAAGAAVDRRGAAGDAAADPRRRRRVGCGGGD